MISNQMSFLQSSGDHLFHKKCYVLTMGNLHSYRPGGCGGFANTRGIVIWPLNSYLAFAIGNTMVLPMIDQAHYLCWVDKTIKKKLKRQELC